MTHYCIYIHGNDASSNQVASIVYTCTCRLIGIRAVCFYNYCSYYISLSKRFFSITLLLHVLVISSWNFHDVYQRFLYNHNRNVSWIRQKMRNFSMGVYGEILSSFVGSSWNYFSGYIKNVEAYHESISSK